MEYKRFSLSDKFMDGYKRKRAPFGFNGLGELVYMRTYSRLKEDGKNEMWWETVQRVVEGTYNMQKNWIEHHQLGWNAWQAQRSAKIMYDRIFTMKFLPPGRGLWAMGTPLTEERKLYAALNNCAFVSTNNLKDDLSKPFCFLMDASMVGVGVGFDTKGAETFVVRGPKDDREPELYKIPDSREGWVESVRRLLDSYFLGITPVEFTYDKIREEGAPIKGFGGVSSGAEPLKEVHNTVKEVLERNIGEPISVTTIVDIMNLIGKCVVAGNVRRTAEIVFGDPSSEEYINLKNYKKNPHREMYGWTSNNSIFAELGMDYTDVAERIKDNGEPGLAWLENMRGYGRMKNGHDHKDHRAAGGNPCLEQTLESYELCCLVETFPDNHTDLDDYLVTLKYAYLYAKTVTLGKTHWSETNRVMLRNRRIGCSVSGIAQFITHRGQGELKKWLEDGYCILQKYDKNYSDWLAVPRSIKTTSVKPSGTVSLLAGATPGLHYPESRFYIRRIRLSVNSPLLKPLEKAGYNIEPAFGSETSTVVIEVPVDVGEGIRTVNDVPMWEQMALAAFMQRYWADNQVSCTVTFDPKKEGKQIATALNYFQYQLKGISMLPKTELGAYKQMPYEEITEKKYHKMVEQLSYLSFRQVKGAEAEIERFCNNDTCEIDLEQIKETQEV
jgi:adenosylcobalamin-dependent ribonucleoside-triphosphate reductase